MGRKATPVACSPYLSGFATPSHAPRSVLLDRQTTRYASLVGLARHAPGRRQIPKNRSDKLLAVLCAAATLLAGCGGGGNGGGSTGGQSAGGSGAVVSGGTFTLAMDSDPGNLDPQKSTANNVFQLNAFAYDSLVSMDQQGTIVKNLATSWQVSGTSVELTLGEGITCADGSPFTAADAAANLNFVANPKNKSPLLGIMVPAGATATAEGSTVRMKLATPAPFLLQGLSNLPMVCRSGLSDRSGLAQATEGTGPYQLSEAVPSDHYTYTKRAGYTWGPGGAGTDTPGLPDQVVVKVVGNQTTAANLLLSGGLSAATVIGPDATRLEKSNLFSTITPTVLGEMWFNQNPKRPGSEPAVRTALTQALDLAQVAKVLTSGQGSVGTTFAVAPPVACPGDSVGPALPPPGLEEARRTLDGAGWTAGADGVRTKNGKPLAVSFLYNTGTGAAGAAAAELATSAWQQLGAKVDLKGQDDTALINTTYNTGNWDVAWLALNVSSPDQLVAFVSGPTPPSGNNFAGIKNPTYAAGVAKASKLQGTEGCPDWLAAESSLVKNADVIPFANQQAHTFGAKVTFDTGSVAVVPTSIRMLAG